METEFSPEQTAALETYSKAFEQWMREKALSKFHDAKLGEAGLQVNTAMDALRQMYSDANECESVISELRIREKIIDSLEKELGSEVSEYID